LDRKKQLIGVPGVVEINSFGGYLRQYEVALKTDRLRAFGISTHEVFMALENANENSGGAYIEKSSSAYFIRAEGLVKNLDDIRQIVVKAMPGGSNSVRISDLAEVNFGYAPRYDAVYPGWQFSRQVPIAQKGYRKAIEAAALQVQVSQNDHENLLLEQRTALAHLLHEQEKYEILLRYYETQGRDLAAELFRSAIAT